MASLMNLERGDKIRSVTSRRRGLSGVLLPLLFCASLWAAPPPDTHKLEQQFREAALQYEGGKLNEAAAQLEQLKHALPQSYEVQELLGLVYSGLGKDDVANAPLEKAARLRPTSAEAHTNLATNLVRLGKLDDAGLHLQKAVELDPRSYDAQHNLGSLKIHQGKIAEAIPSLQAAQRIAPDSYDNGYDLARALLITGRLEEARQQARALLKLKDVAEVHNLLGEIEEKDGKFVAAANEMELAAHQDPSESNLMDWASELLLHRTLDPAVAVFQNATTRYPDSQRLAIGLGIALYTRGNYDDAVKSLLRAVDLNPADPRGYYFLSKAYNASPGLADEVIQRFRRAAELRPNDARLAYYYAMSLWKGRRAQDPNLDPRQIAELLQRAMTLDPGFAEAHFQRANLYADQDKFAEAIPEYVEAQRLDPKLTDVYYRLGQAYVRTGKRDLAQQQFEVYQRLRAENMADLDRQRAEIQQFVYDSKQVPAEKP